MAEVCEMPAFYTVPEEIKEILTSIQIIAIVGLSPKEDRDSNQVAKYLQQQGFKVIPVNPMHPEILGLKSYANLNDIPDKIDLVDIFRKPSAVPEIVDDAIGIGAKVIWMQEGIVHNESAKKAKDANLKVVMSKCIMKEHKRMMETQVKDEYK